MIKDENVFDKCIAIWEKLSTIIKKIILSFIYNNKKYLKLEKGFNTKESFQWFYIPVILFDSILQKRWKLLSESVFEKNYSARFLEKYNKF